MKKITSLHNPIIKSAIKLRKSRARKKDGLIIATTSYSKNELDKDLEAVPLALVLQSNIESFKGVDISNTKMNNIKIKKLSLLN